MTEIQCCNLCMCMPKQLSVHSKSKTSIIQMVHVIVLSLVYMFIVLYEEEKTERKQWTACVIDNLQFYVLNCEFKLINQRQECIMTIFIVQ